MTGVPGAGGPGGSAGPGAPGAGGGDGDGGAEGMRIEVRDLRALGVHGVLPQEQDKAQPFSLDLDVWLDPTPAGASDDLVDTVDYGELVERSLAVVEQRSFALLEALAAAVGDEVLGTDRRIVAVAVTVRKLRPPLSARLGSVGVRAVRRRPG
jgi:7,8-dihydroneopterin aldolase/epimerase/oxygenase